MSRGRRVFTLGMLYLLGSLLLALFGGAFAVTIHWPGTATLTLATPGAGLSSVLLNALLLGGWLFGHWGGGTRVDEPALQDDYRPRHEVAPGTAGDTTGAVTDRQYREQVDVDTQSISDYRRD